jgi:hypothetical protein
MGGGRRSRDDLHNALWEMGGGISATRHNRLYFLKLFLAARMGCFYLSVMETESPRPTLESSLNRVATFIGYGQTKLWTAARALERVGLWQRKPKGRGKVGFPPASCWGNLALCLAVMQTEAPDVAADRVKAFRMLRQVNGKRVGMTFGDAVDELFDLAGRDVEFRGRVFVHPVTIIQLSAGQVPAAQITFGPGTGEYGGPRGIDGMDVLEVSRLMHVGVLGLSCIPRIHGSLIKEFAELLATFRETEAQANATSTRSTKR